MSEIELNWLSEGVDEEEPDFGFDFENDENAITDDDDDGGGGATLWLEEKDGSEDVEDADMFAPELGTCTAAGGMHMQQVSRPFSSI